MRRDNSLLIFAFSLLNGKIIVCNNKVYAGSNKLDLTKDTIYTHPATKQCNYSVNTSDFATVSQLADLEKKIAIGNAGLGTPVLGARIRLGGFDYVIVHITGSVVYAITETCPWATIFGNNTTYSGSTAAAQCVTWYNTYVPATLRNAGIFVNETVNGVTYPCFLPSYEQYNGGFSYFSDNDHRIAPLCIAAGYNGTYNGYWHWTSSVTSTGDVCGVGDAGDLSNYSGHSPSYTYGFRPCLAIARSAFAS